MFTAKFEKDLVKFFKYANEELKIKGQEWSMDLLTEFKEPGRNKLNQYVKEVTKEFEVTDKNGEAIDYKMIMDDFKNVKSKSNESEEVMEGVEVNGDLKTDDNMEYIETLEYSTDELERAMGKSIMYEHDDDYNREWKIKCNGNIYSIYNWDSKEVKDKDIEWHIAGFVKKDKDINLIKMYIKERVNSKKESEETEKEEVDVDWTNDTEENTE